MNFGEKIKALRLERGLTLENVGEMVGVGKSTVRKWESGQIANMRRDKIALIAKALGVSPSYLMGWSEEDKSANDKPAHENDHERDEFAQLFTSLTPENRRRILDLMKVLLEGQVQTVAPHQ